MRTWMQTSTAEFVTRFKDPVLRDALEEMWFPEFSIFFMLFTFAYLHNKNAGYPIGGSLPMSRAMARRYLDRVARWRPDRILTTYWASGATKAWVDRAVGRVLDELEGRSAP